MRTVTKIYLHCSYSEWGSLAVVRKWHLDRGFKDIGYHYVISNQFTTFNQFKKRAIAVAEESGKYSDRLFSSQTDGLIKSGRPLSQAGAAVKNDNLYSIQICYIGILPTTAQWSAMLTLCADLIKKFPLILCDGVYGHYEYYLNRRVAMQKTCPNFCVETFRNHLRMLVEK